MKYVFPAIFTKEDAGYSIRFPDIEGCYTSAETIADGMDMASDVLDLMLMDMEDRNAVIPVPSDISTVVCDKNEFVTLISADTLEYRKMYGSQSVKKTLSVPAWLNTLAEKQDINFSYTLQKALKEVLNIV